MNIKKCIDLLGQWQRLLDSIDSMPAHSKAALAAAALQVGINLSSLLTQTVKTKHRLQEAPEGSFRAVFCVSTRHLQPQILQDLKDGGTRGEQARALGLRFQSVEQGLLLDFAGCPQQWPTSEDLFSLPQLAYWSRLVSASWIVVSTEGAEVDGLPLYPTPEHTHVLAA